MFEAGNLNKFVTVVSSVPLEIQQMVAEFSLRYVCWRNELWLKLAYIYAHFSLEASTSAEIYSNKLKIRSYFPYGVTVFSLEVRTLKRQHPDVIKLINTLKISKVTFIDSQLHPIDLSQWPDFNFFREKGLQVVYIPSPDSSRLNESIQENMAITSLDIGIGYFYLRDADVFFKHDFNFQVPLQCISFKALDRRPFGRLDFELAPVLEKLVRITKLLKIYCKIDDKIDSEITTLNSLISKYGNKVELSSLCYGTEYNQEVSRLLQHVIPNGSLFAPKHILQILTPLRIKSVTVDYPPSQLKNVVCSKLYAIYLRIQVSSIINCNFGKLHVRHFEAGINCVADSVSLRKYKIDQKSIETLPSTVTSLTLACDVKLDTKSRKRLITLPKYLSKFTCRLADASYFNFKDCTSLQNLNIIDVNKDINKSVLNNIPDHLEKLTIDASLKSRRRCPDGRKFEIEMDHLILKTKELELLTDQIIKYICVNMDLPGALRTQCRKWARVNVSNPNVLNISSTPESTPPLIAIPGNSLDLIKIIDVHSMPNGWKKKEEVSGVHVLSGGLKTENHSIRFHF